MQEREQQGQAVHRVDVDVDDRRGRPTSATAVAVLALLAIVVGIGVWLVGRFGAADDRLLVVDEAGAISLLDAGTGEAVYEVPDATATPDRSALLTTSAAGDRTRLETRDPATGEVTGSTTLDGYRLHVRTVSPQGGAVALMPGPKPKGLYEPEPRERTTLAVSYLDDRPARTYELDGNLEPEMFSYDESGLYLLEFLPAMDPTSYEVRRLDLTTGALTDTGAPEVGLDPRMRGRARASVLHPEGEQLFTLYTLPQSGGAVFDPEDDGDAPMYAFVHVIDLQTDRSSCVFLPRPIGTSDEAAVGMGISPDGRELIVADSSTGTLARIDTGELEVVETVPVGRFSGVGNTPAVAIAGDGAVYLGSANRVLELTRPSLQPTRSWAQETTVSALSLTESGDQLRVGGAGAISIVDREDGTEVAVLDAPGRGTVALLGPPRGSVTEFPLECAC